MDVTRYPTLWAATVISSRTTASLKLLRSKAATAMTFSESRPPTRSMNSPVSWSQMPVVTRRFRMVILWLRRISEMAASCPTWSIPKRRTVPVSTLCGASSSAATGSEAASVPSSPSSSPVTPPTVTVQTSRGNRVCRRLVMSGTELSTMEAFTKMATAMLSPLASSSRESARELRKGVMCVWKALTRKLGLEETQVLATSMLGLTLGSTGLGMEVPAASSMFALTRPMTSAMPHQMSLPEDAKV
mmetsp:Transcript_18232/g.41206  ORF Transcript_18232/g.41206 Transcript_18232/m.41206 type:complete len:245 (-) Transcript_18232:251-985(-)